MLIETGRLTPRSLAGQVAVVTGGGGGIGYEAARALVWLGARVVIASFALNQKSVLSVEQAGAGFAASVALADQFRGKEISSRGAFSPCLSLPTGSARS